jgi:nitrite reductase/ring-hydroxylating ferredoxin subunit
MAWVTLCSLDELTEGAGRYVEVDGFDLAVFLSDGEVTVLDNLCPHAGANMADGHIEDGCAVCPRHYWAFDLATGELRGQPGIALQKYPTRLFQQGETRFVQVELPTY